ncbi:hypothetical protein IH980_03215 [Patescibacteria group bacterium]|nr:hypothetical protein [Patescibacteria group bacterium]
MASKRRQIIPFPMKWYPSSLAEIGNQFRRLSRIIVTIQSTLILLLIYYVLLTPFGLVLQIIYRLRNRKRHTPPSYWKKRDFKQDSINIYRQF